jgi:WD40 repeat protein
MMRPTVKMAAIMKWATLLFLTFAFTQPLAAASDIPVTLGQPPLPVRGWIEQAGKGAPAFSPDGGRLLISGEQCRVWDPVTFKPLSAAFPTDFNVYKATFVAGGTQAFAFNYESRKTQRACAQYFDVSSGKPVGPVLRVEGTNGTSFSSGDGRYVGQDCFAEGHHGFAVRILDASTGRVVLSKETDDPMFYSCLNEDGSVLKYMRPGMGRDDSASIHLVRVRDGAALLTEEVKPEQLNVEFSPDGKRVVVGGDSLRVFDLATEKLVAAHTPAQSKSGGPLDGDDSFTADGQSVQFRRGGDVYRWNFTTGAVSEPLFHLSKGEFPICTSRDGHRMLCTYGYDPSRAGYEGLEVVDDSGKRLWTYPREKTIGGEYPGAAISGDGRRIAISYFSHNRTYVLDLNDLSAKVGAPTTQPRVAEASTIAPVAAHQVQPNVGQPPLPVVGHIDGFCYDNAAFSPDGRLILVTHDRHGQLYDAAAFKPVGDQIPAEWEAYRPYFVAEGAMVFAGHIGSYPDKTIRAQFFEVPGGKPLGTPLEIKGEGWAYPSDDGNVLAVAYRQGDMRQSQTYIRVIDRSTSRELLSKDLGRPLAHLWRVSRGGSFLLYTEFDASRQPNSHSRVMRVSDGSILFSSPLEIGDHDTADFSPDGKSVVIPTLEGFTVYDLATQKVVISSRPLENAANPDEQRPNLASRFSDDGRRVLYWRHATLQRWEIAAGKPLPPFVWKGSLDHISFSRDARLMACNYRTNTGGRDEAGTAIFDLDAGRQLWKWPRPAQWGAAVLSGDGRRAIISDSVNDTQYVVDLGNLLPAPGEK